MSPQLKIETGGVEVTDMGYSIQIKETVLQKALSGRKTQHEIATEFGVGKSTIQNWLRHFRKNGDIKLKSKENACSDPTQNLTVELPCRMVERKVTKRFFQG